MTCPECGGEWCVLTLEEEQKIITNVHEPEEIIQPQTKHKSCKRKRKLAPGCWTGMFILFAICFSLGSWVYIPKDSINKSITKAYSQRKSKGGRPVNPNSKRQQLLKQKAKVNI